MVEIAHRCEICNLPVDLDKDEWHNGQRGILCGICNARIEDGSIFEPDTPDEK